MAKECIDFQSFTTQKYGFHPLRLIAADLPMDHLAIDLAQMKTSRDGFNYILVVIDVCTRVTMVQSFGTSTSMQLWNKLASNTDASRHTTHRPMEPQKG